jgi:hypothetical protein
MQCYSLYVYINKLKELQYSSKQYKQHCSHSITLEADEVVS